MSEDVFLDDSRDEVMELVLASDEEFTGDEDGEVDESQRREARRMWWRDAGSRFLPGIEAGAIVALAGALVSALGSLAADQVATASNIASTYTSRGAVNDPVGEYRHYLNLRWAGQGAVAAAAVLLAVLVLARWKEGRHARWSRPTAQAALAIGLITVVVAVLGLTGVVASLPDRPSATQSDTFTG